MYSPLEQFDNNTIALFAYSYPFNIDLSILTAIIPLIITILLLVFFFVFLLHSLSLIPNGWQLIAEKTYCFVLSIIEQQAGKEGVNYTPLLYLVFFFVLIGNLLSLMPFGIALTSQISLILFLSISLSLGIMIIGIIKHSWGFVKIFIPEAPLFLLFVLVPIEIFSYIIRMFSLAIRLSANILAGHTLVSILSSFSISMINVSPFLFFVSLIPLFFIFLLEIGVAFLQAYVFLVLLSIYLSSSLEDIKH